MSPYRDVVASRFQLPASTFQHVAGMPPRREAGSRKPAAESRQRNSLLIDYAEDFFLAHDQVLLAIELDLLAGVLAEEHGVAFLDVERRHLAVLLDFALADGNHLALLRFFLGGVGDDDAPDLLLAFLEALHDHAIV